MSTEFFVYMWINKRNNMRYIGSHKGSTDDGYIGSGVYFKRAYNKEPENFERHILQFYDNEEQMKQGEQNYLEEANAIENEKFYNLTNLSGGGNLHKHLSESQRKEIERKATSARLIKFANMSDDEKEALKKKKQESWKTSNKRDEHSERTRQRRSLEELSKTDEEKKEFSDKMKTAYWSRSKEEIELHHKKHSIAAKASYENNPELLKQRAEQLRTVNVGKIYVNKDGISKFIYPKDLDKFLEEGWSKGRGSFKKKDPAFQVQI